ncbi:DUF6364 family protein [Desulfobacter sp.]|uniref:DUF6364 family protein n=1 Tax=Desulfobacter sp. TaxID=2294 RepID=UPI003D0FB1A9
MNTKLTLRIDDRLIKSAKCHASKMGKSLSQMVADYFILLEKQGNNETTELTPTVKFLKGSLKDAGVDEKDYTNYLAEKYL